MAGFPESSAHYLSGVPVALSGVVMESLSGGDTMVRIVDLRRTGLFVIMRNGAVANVGGRNYWSDLGELKETLRRERVVADERVFHTAP